MRIPRKKKKAYRKTLEYALSSITKKYKMGRDYFILPADAKIEFKEMNP